MLVVYDWLKEYVGDAMPPVEKLEELFTFHAFEIDGVANVRGHDVIDVKVLPDRSSDCLSHRGIARELSTLINQPLVKDPLKNVTSLTPLASNVTVTIEHEESCRRFGAALVTGIAITESPQWLKERLQALGQRSINNVVDATNYVMLALGQPLHAYDAEKFPHENGTWQFGVRMAREGEEITTLTNDSYVLTPQVQLIVDASTDAPVGIAGIKGGKFAEVDSSTTAIIIEAANFDSRVTRRATQAIKLQTDASKRFENIISPELIPYALRDVVALVLEIAGGKCDGYVDVYPRMISNKPVTVTLDHIQALLGLTLTASIVESIFSRLGFAYIAEDGGWQVNAPFERTDITIAEDLIAEVGRIYGYEHVQSVVPATVPLSEYNARHYYSEKIRRLLVDVGFSEVITSSFRKKDHIELHNALASDKGCLRSVLSENIREVLDRNMPNVDLLGLTNVQVFEIGTVFNKNPEEKGIIEHVSLALGVRMKQQGYSPKDDERLKEVLTAIEETLGIPCGATIERGILECDMSALITLLPTPTSYEPFLPGSERMFAPYSMYPFISRDIALWVSETVSVEEVSNHIKAIAGKLLTRATLFDEFKKDGRISYAFRLFFQSFERTLTDSEVGNIMENVTKNLISKGYSVR